MYHPIDSNFLYCALKIHVTFCDENGKQILANGTGFAVSVNGRAVLVTNRHVLDSGFVNPKKKDWSIQQIVVTGYGNSGSYFELLLSEWMVLYSNNPLEDIAAVTIDSFFPNIDMPDFAGVVNFASEFLADDQFYSGINLKTLF